MTIVTGSLLCFSQVLQGKSICLPCRDKLAPGKQATDSKRLVIEYVLYAKKVNIYLRTSFEYDSSDMFLCNT